jgi:hypothetical protein
MQRWILLLTLFGFLSALPARASADFGPPSSLTDNVFDPDGILDQDLTGSLAELLERLLKEDGLDIRVVVLKQIGDTPPELIARQFSPKWRNPELHAVVVHMPDRADSPWIIPGGRFIESLPLEKVKQEVSGRELRARSVLDDFGRVRAACAWTAEMLRFWKMEAMIQRGVARQANHLPTVVAPPRPWRQWSSGFVLLAVVSIGVSGGIALHGRRRHPPVPFHFPDHGWKPRLGAPYAGGNHVVHTLVPSRKRS